MSGLDPLLEFAERARKAQEAVNALGAGPPIPAQTITLSPDAFGKEMADRLQQGLAGFRVFRSSYYVRLRHDPCMVVLRTTPDVPLLELVIAAMNHECPQGELT